MKKSSKMLSAGLAAMIILFEFSACAVCKPRAGHMGSLVEFHYFFGSPGGYWDYRIYERNGKTRLWGEGHNGVELNGESEVPGDTLGHIGNIIGECGIARWNGFSRFDEDMLDGYSFRIEAVYENGEIAADGYGEIYPPDYEAGHGALRAYLDKLARAAGLLR